MDLTPIQERTLERLIGTGAAPAFDPGLAARIRSSIEDRMRAAGADSFDRSIWVGKRRLVERDRCEGLLQAAVLEERRAFEHSTRTAAGVLFHKAIEIDVGTERGFDPRTVCERAAERLASDPSFAAFWAGLHPFDRSELVMDAGRHLTLFRDSFPPLRRRWAPQPELRIRVRLLGGRVVLSGAPDLVLGRTRRLAIDFKSGGAWPEHPEDMRFYALLVLLRTGVPPYRVATFFLESGDWQAEDVTEGAIGRAADRTVETVATAVRLLRGGVPDLSPGRHCGWCPRRIVCPVSRAAA